MFSHPLSYSPSALALAIGSGYKGLINDKYEFTDESNFFIGLREFIRISPWAIKHGLFGAWCGGQPSTVKQILDKLNESRPPTVLLKEVGMIAQKAVDNPSRFRHPLNQDIYIILAGLAKLPANRSLLYNARNLFILNRLLNEERKEALIKSLSLPLIHSAVRFFETRFLNDLLESGLALSRIDYNGDGPFEFLLEDYVAMHYMYISSEGFTDIIRVLVAHDFNIHSLAPSSTESPLGRLLNLAGIKLDSSFPLATFTLATHVLLRGLLSSGATLANPNDNAALILKYTETNSFKENWAPQYYSLLESIIEKGFRADERIRLLGCTTMEFVIAKRLFEWLSIISKMSGFKAENFNEIFLVLLRDNSTPMSTLELFLDSGIPTILATEDREILNRPRDGVKFPPKTRFHYTLGITEDPEHPSYLSAALCSDRELLDILMRDHPKKYHIAEAFDRQLSFHRNYHLLKDLVISQHVDEENKLTSLLEKFLIKHLITYQSDFNLALFLIKRGAHPIILHDKSTDPDAKLWLAKLGHSAAFSRRRQALTFYLACNDVTGTMYVSHQYQLWYLNKSPAEKLQSKLKDLVAKGSIIWDNGCGVEESKTPEGENSLSLNTSTSLLSQAKAIADHLQLRDPASAAEWRELIADYEKAEIKRLVTPTLAPGA
ncbi:MAG: hypothetical protein Q7V63_01525 [Gammaproteobacteria bacterium]|nr:hypothetical protein [Gammaproteobacteria bacterium]